MKEKLTVVTPHGAFSRTTGHDYKFMAVLYYEHGLIGGGGDRNGPAEPWAVWSLTKVGIDKLVRKHGAGPSIHGNLVSCLGVYPVPEAAPVEA